MKKGYGVFGKAYEVMFQNDLHDKHSIDHYLLSNMILLDNESNNCLYQKPKSVSDDVRFHGLYSFSQQFKGSDDLESIRNVMTYLKKIVKKFDAPFEDMYFGGTEKEIIKRGTDWCADISRVGVALLQCLYIPSRILIIVNKDVAYNGHQVVEAYVNGKYMMCDFLYGVIGKVNTIYSVHDLLNKPGQVKNIYQSNVKDDSQLDYISGLYKLAAISEYDVTKNYNYNISRPNEYYLKMMRLKHKGQWQMGEIN
jgi:hypothetical protein